MSLSLGRFSYNGLTMGPGTAFQWNTIDGLTGLPDVRSGNVARPNNDGLLAGYDYLGGRTVTFNLEVVGTVGGNTMQENLALARAAFLPVKSLGGGVNAPSSQQFAWNLGEGNGAIGVSRFVVARCEKFDVPVDQAWSAGGFQYGMASVAVQLSATDPLIYDANIQSASIGLTVAVGGWTFPWTFPWTFATSSSTTITAVNAGSIACPAYVVLTGPCTNPRVQNQTTGVTVELDTTLTASDTLVLDAYSGTAVLNGTAERLNALAPGSYVTDLTVAPGSNTFAWYSADGVATGATMTLYWANTWA